MSGPESSRWKTSLLASWTLCIHSWNPCALFDQEGLILSLGSFRLFWEVYSTWRSTQRLLKPGNSQRWHTLCTQSSSLGKRSWNSPSDPSTRWPENRQQGLEKHSWPRNGSILCFFRRSHRRLLTRFTTEIGMPGTTEWARANPRSWIGTTRQLSLWSWLSVHRILYHSLTTFRW